MWAAAQANGVHVFIHTQTGGVKVNDTTATTLKVVMEQAAQVNQPMTEKSASKRMITQCVYGPMVPQQVMCELIGGGVPERYPDLHFALIEFNAHWLASLVGSMDKCWVTGIGQDADWWLGNWDDTRPDDDQPGMAQLFRLNDKWPYPLAPSEYVRRQFHVSFQDDPVAVACRHITGLVDDRVGQRLPARGRDVPRKSRADREAARRSPRRRAGRARRRHARRAPRLRSTEAVPVQLRASSRSRG